MAARHEEGRYEKSILKHFLGCEGLSDDDVGAARGTVFQEIRPDVLVSKPAISLKKSWGGYRRTTLWLGSTHSVARRKEKSMLSDPGVCLSYVEGGRSRKKKSLLGLTNNKMGGAKKQQQ